MAVKLLPYKQGSQSSKALAEALGVRRLKVRDGQYVGRQYVPRREDVIINWGNATLPRFHEQVTWLNHPSAVSVASSKRQSLALLSDAGVPTPPWTVDRNEATRWLNEGALVVCRQLDRGSGGRGIVLCRLPDGDHDDELGITRLLPGGPLPVSAVYTKYVKKKDEYRVHVLGGQVIDVQQKRLRNGIEQPNFKVRNHDAGWVFCRENVTLPDAARTLATRAAEALGLDFGAVDLIHNTREGFYVLEVNSAPGLEGTTLETYAAAIRGHLDGGDGHLRNVGVDQGEDGRP